MKSKILNPELNYVVFTKRAKPISDFEVENTYQRIKDMKCIEISNLQLLNIFRLGVKNSEIKQFNLIVEDLDGKIYEDIVSIDGCLNECWASLILSQTVENNIEECADELNYKSFTVSDESVETEKEITQGTIVQATRKGGTSDKDYTWQGVYFGYCNGKHLIDANTTHVMLADEIEVISTLTKKEAKQKISELFSNPKNVTSEKVRNIIDLIKI